MNLELLCLFPLTLSVVSLQQFSSFRFQCERVSELVQTYGCILQLQVAVCSSRVLKMKTLIHGDWLYFYIRWKTSGWGFYGMTPCPILKATSLLVLYILQEKAIPRQSQCCSIFWFLLNRTFIMFLCPGGNYTRQIKVYLIK